MVAAAVAVWFKKLFLFLLLFSVVPYCFTNLVVCGLAMSSSTTSSSSLIRKHTLPINQVVAPDPPPTKESGWEPVFFTDGSDEDNNKRTLVKTSACLNYVGMETPNRVRMYRDAHGNDNDGGNIITWEETPVWIYNGRLLTKQLHRNGFELVIDDDEISAGDIDDDNNIDFLNSEQVLELYYPYCQRLLQRHLLSLQEQDGAGGSSNRHGVTVVAFDHNVRQQQQTSDGKSQKPLAVVHGDYTIDSAPRRLELLAEPPKINDTWRKKSLTTGSNDDDVNGASQPSLLDPEIVRECLAGKRRYSFINVWKNIDRHNPIQQLPLACMDVAAAANTNQDDDKNRRQEEDEEEQRLLRILEVEYEDRVGENYLSCHDPSSSHHWVYYPQMEYHESLLIKQWDSIDGTYSLHTAFIDPTSPTQDAPPRQSIEVRCVAIWD